MRAIVLAAACAAGLMANASAQTPYRLPPPARVVPLYDGVPPDSECWTWNERTIVTLRGNFVTQNVVKPTLSYYPAERAKATGAAVIIAPGGGFTNLMMAYEGIEIIQALNAIGVDAFLLKYRLVYVDPALPLPPPGVVVAPPAPVTDGAYTILAGPQKGANILEISSADARRAVRWVRANAATLGDHPDRIGMIGFSAGGAVTLAVATGQEDARPDFIGVVYGASMPTNRPLVTAPPLFLAVAADDVTNAEGSINAYVRWRREGRPAELHIFQTGGHGFRHFGGGADHFMDRFGDWMRANGWLNPARAR
jgi:alpha/beta hydrolase fold